MSLDILSLLICCVWACAGACFALAVLAHGTVPESMIAQRSRVMSSNRKGSTHSQEDNEQLKKALKDLAAEKNQVRLLKHQLWKERNKQKERAIDSRKVLDDLEAEKQEVRWLNKQLKKGYKKQEKWTKERMQLKGTILSMSSVIAAYGRDAYASGKKIKVLEAVQSTAANDPQEPGDEQNTINDHIRDADTSKVMRENLQEEVKQHAKELATANKQVKVMGDVIASYAQEAFQANDFEKQFGKIVESYGIDEVKRVEEWHEKVELGQQCLMQGNLIQQLRARLTQYEDSNGQPRQTPAPGRTPGAKETKPAAQGATDDASQKKIDELEKKTSQLEQALEEARQELTDKAEEIKDLEEALAESFS